MAFHTGAEDVFSLQQFKNSFYIISLFRAVMVLKFKNPKSAFLKTLPSQGHTSSFFP